MSFLNGGLPCPIKDGQPWVMLAESGMVLCSSILHANSWKETRAGVREDEVSRGPRFPVVPVCAVIKGICGVLDETSRGCQAGGILSWGLSAHRAREPGVPDSAPAPKR